MFSFTDSYTPTVLDEPRENAPHHVSTRRAAEQEQKQDQEPIREEKRNSEESTTNRLDVLQQNIVVAECVVGILATGKADPFVVLSRPDTSPSSSPPRVRYIDSYKAECSKKADSACVKRQICTCVNVLGDRIRPSKRLKSWFASDAMPTENRTWVDQCGREVASRERLNLDE